MIKYYWLVFYNSVCLIGWSFILIRLFVLLFTGYSIPETCDILINSLLVTQTLALFEILHSAMGMTNSKLIPTVMQVFSRLYMSWFIVFGDTVVHYAFIPMLFAWYPCKA